MITVRPPLETAKLLIDKLSDNKPFYFVRFGDGDLLMMLVPNFTRQKLHKYDSQLRRDLYHCFHVQDENFLIGCVDNEMMYEGCRGLVKINPQIKDRLNMHTSIMFDDVTYESAVPFHAVLYNDKKPLMLELIKNFQNKNVLYIGGGNPLKSENFKKFFNISDSIVLGDRDAYQELKNNWDKYAEKAKNYDVVIPACGLGSRPLAYHFHQKNINVQFIDIGSVIDAFANLKTRSWIPRYKDKIDSMVDFINKQLFN